ncbi:NAD-dependent epimerase/dehydratase family protein [Dictyobacter aurantiacus]|uniref:NAD-dependent epimerase n=1 Tax=Dictyobacter aurantiacus TaxID=1936993 RepID=A0A401Z805_9CHLR|nr:NAD(P)-dependent oxidoreductase [Dictyobacter aurantiacus]GCE02972.1 NAD-dependent epimerase [Dictyobacter aurantiacus]
MHVVVTGASGRLGRTVVALLQAKGFKVIGIDKRPCATLPVPLIQLDLCNIDQVQKAMAGADAIVHLGAIPSPGGFPAEVVYSNNILGTFNVFEVADRLGIRRVVYASSVSALGFPFQRLWSEPAYFPIDEAHPLLPQDPYGLSKANGEEIAAAYCRRGAGSAASLRISTIVDEADLSEKFESARIAPENWASSLWSYVEVRDVAHACFLALTTPFEGHLPCFITAAETISEIPTNDLLQRWFPHVPYVVGESSPHWSLLNGSCARDRLGYVPRYRWSDLLLHHHEKVNN